MISTIKNVWLCTFGPHLYKIYNGPLYTQGSLEKWGDQIIQSLTIMLKISMYTSPIIGLYLYKKDYMETKSLVPLIKIMTSLGIVVTTSLTLRGYGRSTNPQYTEFIKSLSTNNITALRRFDFNFYAWPVDFDCQTVEESKGKRYSKPSSAGLKTWKEIPVYVIGQFVVQTFGLKLIYPGSISLLQMTIFNALLEGRVKLVEEYSGQRYKLRTRDSNDIDCMFVDRRNSSRTNRHVLVITSEGNAGFYEIGIMTTPIEAGFSVLGWNHPGFGGSTGKPYPSQEQHAFDTVIQFAIHKLGFAPENIVLFGWSIGCYSVAWAAVQYPEIRGIVLDATFDDILPLAQARMPSSWKPLVREVIRGHVDLNIAEILHEYTGPIKLIRRTLDEIICVQEGVLSTNKGNNLLIKVISQRYPNLIGEEQLLLLKNYLSVLGPARAVLMKDGVGQSDQNKKVLFLAGKLMSDYQSTHCTPLPVDLFEIPQDLNKLDDSPLNQKIFM